MSPADAVALLDAVIECRKTSRELATTNGRGVAAATAADDAAFLAVTTMISELTV